MAHQSHGNRGRSLTTTAHSRAAAVLVLLAPVVLLAAIAYHPFIENLGDPEAVGHALHADEARWGIVHYATLVGGALVLLAFLAVRALLRDAGEDTWSARAIPLLVAGSALFVALPAMEVGALAGAQAGGDAVSIHEALGPWFTATVLTQAALVTVGSILLAMGVTRSDVLGKGTGRVVAVALVVGGAARFVPLGVALYVVAIATLAALWPMGVALWRTDEDARAERAWRMAAG